jgi:hypothetical protein
MGFKDKRDLHRYQRTSLANSGRAAGMGISYDRYDDESMGRATNPHYSPIPRLEMYTEEEREEMTKPGEVITYYISKKEAREK